MSSKRHPKKLKVPRYDLEHPDVRWWIVEDEFWFEVATKHDCIVSKAEIYSHLQIFADYESKDKPSTSLIRQRLLEEIKAIVAQDTVDPFHVILAVLALPHKTLDLDLKKYAARCDARVFRLARRRAWPEILRDLPAQPNSSDWLYYQATLSGSLVDYRTASEAGSLEATLYLARVASVKYYLHAIHRLGVTGVAYEYAERTKNRAMMLRLGTPRALAICANFMLNEGKRVSRIKQWCRDHGVPLFSKKLLPSLQEQPDVPAVDEDTLYLDQLSSLLGYTR